LYMEWTKNLALSCRFHQNSSIIAINWTKAKRWSKAFQDATLRPIKSPLSVTFGGGDSITVAMVIALMTNNII
jgi:hypothetical protein